MNRLMRFFPLSNYKSEKQTFFSFILYILINLVTRLLKKLFAESSLYAFIGTFSLFVNIYIYVGIFLLAYNFILNTKR